MHALLERLPGLECKELCLAVMPDHEAGDPLLQETRAAGGSLFLEKHL